MKVCRFCGKDESESEFYPVGSASRKSAGNCCKKCWSSKSTMWREDPAKYAAWLAANHKRDTMRAYGMTEDEYDYLYTDPVCAGCGTRTSTSRGRSQVRLVVDHNHETGKVRGLLCHDCNRTIATAHDDPEILRGLATYLEETA